MDVPVELNYSPMALKYIYFKKFVSSKEQSVK
jgi:hypothetical protein